MLEQWQARDLLRMPKIYSRDALVDLSAGVDDDLAIESEDGAEFFLLDVWRSRRSSRKARFQLRYRRGIVLARLCTSIPHTNPDGEHIGAPHLHLFREGYEAKWAEGLAPFPTHRAALEDFCKRINLPTPDIQGGVV
ncbi:DUF6978 family protein [Cryptosporangium aurantiacum]|uniref:DUF6978 family protein n=1 Tax=Cryptosporangium aurantiacum TaxID=134849 RepID=UPI0015BA0EAA|nr:hypothetical protein [Cryptosporangium aurantiacum]